jgi:hypothetical protein
MLYFYCCGLRGFFFFRMTDGAQDTKGWKSLLRKSQHNQL